MVWVFCPLPKAVHFSCTTEHQQNPTGVAAKAQGNHNVQDLLYLWYLPTLKQCKKSIGSSLVVYPASREEGGRGRVLVVPLLQMILGMMEHAAMQSCPSKKLSPCSVSITT